jgi:anti-repressor protein
MNDLQVFKNSKFGEIRTFVEQNGSITFCGMDVAKALGYSNTRDALARHCKTDGVVNHDVIDSLGRTQQAKFISEGNLYRLIAGSHLPEAEKFESWIFDEVIPAIRKTGGYVNNDEVFINTYLPFADEQTKAMFRATLETVRKLNAKIEQDKPKVLFANAVETSKSSILIGDLAKLIRQNGYNIGQNRLFEWLRNNGYLIKNGERRNMPTQKSMDLGLFEIKERTINNPDGSIRITKTVKVTGKGQEYFINKFLGVKRDVS